MQEHGNADERLREPSGKGDAHGGSTDGDTRVYPGAPEADAADGRAARRLPRPALAGLALSLLLIACAVGYFAANPGSLDFPRGSESAFQTTAGPSGSSDGAGEKDGAPTAGGAGAVDGPDEGAAASADGSQGASVRDSVSTGPAAADSSSGAADSPGQSTGASGGSSSASPNAQAPSGDVGGGAVSQDPAVITVRVVVDSSAADGSVSADTTLTFEEGATAYDALCATGLSVNARNSGFGVYVAGIGGLAEFDFGGESGWKYSVNGSMPGYSSSSYALHDGDVVRWVYATSL